MRPVSNVVHVFRLRLSGLLVIAFGLIALSAGTIAAQHGCPSADTITIRIQGGIISPTNTGHNFDTAFVCRSVKVSIGLANEGCTKLTITQIDILKETSPVAEFFFNNGMQTLPVNSILNPLSRKSFPLNFSPVHAGWDTAVVQVTWDSAGVKKIFTSNLLIGYGAIDSESLVPSEPDYTVQNYDTLNIPLDLTNTLSANDGAMGMTFAITYPSDLLTLLTTMYDPTLVGLNAPQTSSINGQTTTTYTLQSAVPITNLSPVMNLQFIANSGNDTSCTVSISNLFFWGNCPLDTLCYIKTSSKNANVHITDTISTNLNLSAHIKAVNQGNLGISIESSSLNLGTARIRIISTIGIEVASWSGTVTGDFNKVLSVPTSGPYIIAVQIGGQEYFYQRILY